MGLPAARYSQSLMGLRDSVKSVTRWGVIGNIEGSRVVGDAGVGDGAWKNMDSPVAVSCERPGHREAKDRGLRGRWSRLVMRSARVARRSTSTRSGWDGAGVTEDGAGEIGRRVRGGWVGGAVEDGGDSGRRRRCWG